MKMAIEIMRRALRCMYEILFSSLIYTFFSIIAFKSEPLWSVYMTIAFIAVLSYVIREKMPNYILIIITHILMAVGVFCSPFEVGIKILICIFTLNCMIDSYIFARRNGYLRKMTEAPWPSILFCFIFYLFGVYIKNDLLINMTYIIPVILLVLYLAIHYLDGLREYIDTTHGVSGKHLKSVIMTNSSIVATIVCIVIACIFMAKIFHFENAFFSIGGIIKEIARVIILVVIMFYKIIASLITTGTYTQAISGIESEMEYGNIVNKTAQGLEIILMLGVFVCVIFVIYKLAVKFIKQMLKKRRFDTDTVEKAVVLYDQKREKINIIKRIKYKLSKEEKARRYYKNKIIRYKNDVNINDKSSCRQIQNDLNERLDVDVCELTDLYSDIRYGEAYVDKNVIKKMSKLSR